MDNIILTLVAIIFTVIVGYQAQSLTMSGALAAAVVGVSVALAYGYSGLYVLGIFFVSSSFWSKYKRDQKAKIEQKHEKGARRDWQQVFANGGIASLCSLLFYFKDHHFWILAFSIAIASANSDTWASEIGALSKKAPLFIRNLKRAEKGTSGAISLLGTLAAVGGALLIAVVSGYLFELSFNEIFLILFCGFFGNVIDTLCGAFLQATYHCENCTAVSEKKVHCGQSTRLIRGFAIMNNDVVNFLSCLFAVVIGLSLAPLIL
jgi:uncharacterized protein (TIGR00297 family)